MKKGKLTFLAMIFLTAVFIGPQLYKTFHIFTDHHGHFNCEAMQPARAGIHLHNDHCPLCAFQFTTFEYTAHQHVDPPAASLFVYDSAQPENVHFVPCKNTFRLRAPPSQPALS